MGSGMTRIWAGSETPGFGGFERRMRWDFSIGSVYGREVVLVFDWESAGCDTLGYLKLVAKSLPSKFMNLVTNSSSDSKCLRPTLIL